MSCSVYNKEIIPLMKKPIRANPEAVHALQQNSPHNNWHFAITLHNYSAVIIPNHPLNKCRNE